MEQTQDQSKKRFVTLLLALLLMVAFATSATVAFLSYQTGNTTNTFTATDGIVVEDTYTVTEHEATNQDGNFVLTGNEVTENTYDALVPNMVLPKDPAVTCDVEKNVGAYIFVKVEDTTDGNITWAIDDANWTPVVGYDNVFVYNNGNPVVGTDSLELSGVNVLKNKTVQTAGSLNDIDAVTDGIQVGNLVFKSIAVQSQGFANAAAAWASFAAQTVDPIHDVDA